MPPAPRQCVLWDRCAAYHTSIKVRRSFVLPDDAWTFESVIVVSPNLPEHEVSMLKTLKHVAHIEPARLLSIVRQLRHIILSLVGSYEQHSQTPIAPRARTLSIKCASG